MELQKNSLNQNVNVVMTDEQVETLRKQIAVYAVISEQLLQMHKNQGRTGKFRVIVSHYSLTPCSITFK